VFALADAVATDEEPDEDAEGEAATLVMVAPRREVGSRKVGSQGGRTRVRGLRAREGVRRACSFRRTPPEACSFRRTPPEEACVSPTSSSSSSSTSPARAALDAAQRCSGADADVRRARNRSIDRFAGTSEWCGGRRDER